MFYISTKDSASVDKLQRDLQRILVIEQGLEAVMRVRCSKGLACSTYYGNFLLRGSDLITFPVIDADKTIFVELRYEENATNIHTLTHYTIQSALLYSTTSGERRIRVSTILVPVSSNLMDLYATISSSVVSHFLMKSAFELAIKDGLLKAREFVQNRCLAIMSSYRSIGGATRLPLATIQDYPDSLVQLPFFILSILKSIALKDGTDTCADDRAAMMHRLFVSSLRKMELNLHPRFFCISDMLADDHIGVIDFITNVCVLPAELVLSASELNTEGVYLLDNGLEFFIRIGLSARIEFVNTLFVENDNELIIAPISDSFCSDLPSRFANILNFLRDYGRLNQSVRIFKEGSHSKVEAEFLNYLVVDRTMFAISYDEFIPFIARSTAI